MSTTLLRNRHPADLLADIRAEIKQLEIQEAEIRQHLLDGGDRRGIQWEAIVHDCTQDRLDAQAAIKHFGPAMDPFLKKVEFQAVRLRRRK